MGFFCWVNVNRRRAVCNRANWVGAAGRRPATARVGSVSMATITRAVAGAPWLQPGAFLGIDGAFSLLTFRLPSAGRARLARSLLQQPPIQRARRGHLASRPGPPPTRPNVAPAQTEPRARRLGSLGARRRHRAAAAPGGSNATSTAPRAARRSCSTRPAGATHPTPRNTAPPLAAPPPPRFMPRPPAAPLLPGRGPPF